MNDFQLKKIMHSIDLVVLLNPLADLEVAKELIERNGDLLIKYPSLEDSLKLLSSVIDREGS